MDARSIADFLILDARFPRSPVFCYSTLRENLAELARLHGAEGDCHAAMREADLRLNDKTVEDIFEQGLHQFLIEFIAGNQLLAGAIAQDYRFVR
jgi:uncharacterized alpha-E superfamily protein